MEDLNLYHWYQIITSIIAIIAAVVAANITFVQRKYDITVNKINKNTADLIEMHNEHSNRLTKIETSIKSMPEYKNMDAVKDDINKSYAEQKKIEGQLLSLEKAFTELTHRVNSLPVEIKTLMSK